MDKVEEPQLTDPLKVWTVMMMRSSTRCPNPGLRLELLRFIAMFDLEDMMDEDIVSNVTFAILYNTKHLTMTRLLPMGRTGLVWPLRKVLYHFSGLLGALLRRSCDHIQQLAIGNVERSVSYLVVLMGQAAKRVLWLRRNGHLTPLGTVDQLMNILHILRLLVATPPNHEVFEEPGMCRIAAAAIAVTCRCIVQTPDSPAPAARQSFVKLVCEVNDFMALLVFQVKGTVVEELRRYHGGCLSYIAAKMNQLGCSAASVPEPLKEVTQPAPERFLDTKTGRLMEAPVKLLVSGQVVDRATLLLLKLATAVDPETGVPVQDLSFEPLISLQDQIHAWTLQQQQLREHT